MKTEIQPVTPSEIGLTLAILSGPRGSVRDGDWPCIEYTCQLSDSRRRIVWTGEYARGQTVKKTPRGMAVEASAAAKLAKAHKVAPKLDGVMRSLLSDGSAYFDGLRFEEWASEYGYSSDSIKAKETFEACDRIGRDLSRALSRDELAGLREWSSNY